MKYIILFLLLPLFSSAQTFYVEGKDDRSRRYVEDKVKFEGYSLSDSAKADYKVQLLIDGSYKVVSFKQPYKGYIRIVDNHSGEEISRTKTIGRSPVAVNGYNAAWSIFTTLSKRYLATDLKKCKPKQ